MWPDQTQVQISIRDTRTEHPRSLLERKYTVLSIQVYVVEVVLGKHTVTVERRYSEFRKLWDNMQLQMLAVEPKILFPEFPKAVLLPLKASVVQARKLGLEAFLRRIMDNPSLTSHVFNFFGIPLDFASEASAPEEEEPQAPELNEGEEAIWMLHTRLSNCPYNKCQILIDFDQDFFQSSSSIQPDYITSLLNNLLPLCGDAVCGSKALHIINKVLLRAQLRSSHEFKVMLVKTPVEELARMKLDGHLLEEFSGDSQAQAFSICSVLTEYFPDTKLLKVLNNRLAALSKFQNWANGSLTIVSPTSRPNRKYSHEWIESDCSHYPGLYFRHKCETTGELKVAITLHIQASCVHVAGYISDPKKRMGWDKVLRVGRVIRKLTESSSLMELAFEFDQHMPSLISYTEVSFEQGRGNITFKKVTDPATPDSELSACPVISSYFFQTATESQFPHLSEHAKTSQERPSEESSLKRECCIMEYSSIYWNEFRQSLAAELLGERSALKENWFRLKTTCELQPTNLGEEQELLCVASANKILRKSSHHNAE